MDPTDTQSAVRPAAPSAPRDGEARRLRLNRPFGLYLVLLVAAMGIYCSLAFVVDELPAILSPDRPIWFKALMVSALASTTLALVAGYGLWRLRPWGAPIALLWLVAELAEDGWIQFARYEVGLQTRTEAIDSFTLACLLFGAILVYVLTPSFRARFRVADESSPRALKLSYTERTVGIEITAFVVALLALFQLPVIWAIFSHSALTKSSVAALFLLMGVVLFAFYALLCYGLWSLQLWARTLAILVFGTQIALGVLTLLLSSLAGSSAPALWYVLILGYTLLCAILLTYITSPGVGRVLGWTPPGYPDSGTAGGLQGSSSSCRVPGSRTPPHLPIL